VQSEPFNGGRELRNRQLPGIGFAELGIACDVKAERRRRLAEQSASIVARVHRGRVVAESKDLAPLTDDAQAECVERENVDLRCRGPSTAERRFRRVAAAAVVKVMARMLDAGTDRSSTRKAMRPTRAVVFPAPGPARMLRGPSTA
jgi:hypothetical protein